MGEIVELNRKSLISMENRIDENAIGNFLCRYFISPKDVLIIVKKKSKNDFIVLDGHHRTIITELLSEIKYIPIYGYVVHNTRDLPTNVPSNFFFDEKTSDHFKQIIQNYNASISNIDETIKTFSALKSDYEFLSSAKEMISHYFIKKLESNIMSFKDPSFNGRFEELKSFRQFKNDPDLVFEHYMKRVA